MKITATQFQLSVNEYFSKLSQGEDIIISRYGRPFAKLVPYKAATEEEKDSSSAETVASEDITSPVPANPTTELPRQDLTKEELIKIVKLLIK